MDTAGGKQAGHNTVDAIIGILVVDYSDIMKPQLHKLPLINDNSFLYNRLCCSYFDKPWHFHEEYELVLIEQSQGTKFIGDNVSLFQDGELMLIGSNIPHLFRNNENYYKKNGKLQA